MGPWPGSSPFGNKSISPKPPLTPQPSRSALKALKFFNRNMAKSPKSPAEVRGYRQANQPGRQRQVHVWEFVSA